VRLPRGWPLLVGAAAAIGLAVYAGANEPVATAFALVALVAIGLMVLWPAGHAAVDPRSGGPPRVPEAESPFRAALQAGRSGRADVVAQLDEVERRTSRPDRPQTTGPELSRIRGLSRDEFRGYVRARLDQIEGEYW
jgi:hypothetical protein